MDYTDFRNKLTAISTDSACLVFLADRIRQNDYRGLHMSQHNRFTFDKATAILTALKRFAGNEKIKIRTQDIAKHPADMAGTEIYSQFCAHLTEKYGGYTQDTVRKNFFVDFARMGLIKRFAESGREINGNRGCCTYVQLAERGKILASRRRTKKEKYVAFTKGLDLLFQGMPLNLFGVMSETDKKITRKEYTYFASFINRRIYNGAYPAGKTVTAQDVINYIAEYRNLRPKHDEIDAVVREYCDPYNNYYAEKPERRDYGNWLNETDQTFTLLNETVFFEHLKKYHTLKLRTEGRLGEETALRIKRSSQEKENYYKEHRIKKPDGTTLHHIVPLSEWKDLNDFKLLDDWRNMICMEENAHKAVHDLTNAPVNLSFSADRKNMILSSDCSLTFSNNAEVFYREAKIAEMEKYNKNLLSTLGI
ncbi:MAG: hypothetical protein NC131_04645 [Roseburia sp.]|nr:hypothetical protein [Roseburia sp.]